MIKNIMTKYKEDGLSSLFNAIYRRLNPIKAKSNILIRKIVSSGYGLEIGGFSPVFDKKGIVPVYNNIQNLDNCNFSSSTVWEGKVKEGNTYSYSSKHSPSKQYVLEATNLNNIKDESYDFLLSSHVIEHTANPIKALHEWIRVVKVGGYLIVLIPHKDGTFDHDRPTTSLDHLMQDYQNDIDEKDLTHLDEILNLHDLELDPEAGTHAQFAKRSKNNYDNRCLHHHVFDSSLVFCLFDYMQLNIIAIEAIAPLHILVIVQKPQKDIIPDNRSLSDHLHSCKWKTPFTSDKI